MKPSPLAPRVAPAASVLLGSNGCGRSEQVVELAVLHEQMFFNDGSGDVFNQFFEGSGTLGMPCYQIIKCPQQFTVEQRVKLHILVIVLPENFLLVTKVFNHMITESG